LLNVTIICVGRLKESYFSEASKEYQKRLGAFCRLVVEEVPESRLPVYASQAEVDAALSKEADAVELRLPKKCLLIAMCIEGKELDSVQLSQFIQLCEKTGKSHLCFLIGGSLGLHKRLKERAEIKLSVSKMTFPHHLFRVMLLEQLYRAHKISEGGKYHK
jgi:23S rRNA (pseudouridine1915-N3)-methyltransferase